jgi:hypothetical protein
VRPLLALLLAAALPACALFRPASDDPVVCTMEYRTISVEVVDDAGNPVGGLTPTVRNLRTGEVLPFDEGAFGGEGHYLVATDAHRERLSEEGDRLLFNAAGGGRVAEAEFVVAADPCHVQKVSGPERIVAMPGGG